MAEKASTRLGNITEDYADEAALREEQPDETFEYVLKIKLTDGEEFEIDEIPTLQNAVDFLLDWAECGLMGDTYTQPDGTIRAIPYHKLDEAYIILSE